MSERYLDAGMANVQGPDRLVHKVQHAVKNSWGHMACSPTITSWRTFDAMIRTNAPATCLRCVVEEWWQR